MSRRRSERRKEHRAPGVERGTARNERVPFSKGAITAAGLLALICLTPFVFWGSNPYPANVVWYWSWGTFVVFALAAFVAFGPKSVGAAVSQARTTLERPSWRSIALVAAVTAFAASVAVAWYMFRLAPTTSDEIAQLWHARILLEGRWFLPPDPHPEFVALENVIDKGRWYSQFPIGGPLLMTLGAALGVVVGLFQVWIARHGLRRLVELVERGVLPGPLPLQPSCTRTP